MKSRLFAFVILCIAAHFIIPQTLQAQPPSGYYSTATGTGATLKTQLYNIIKGHTVRSYDQLWTDFQSTDVKSNGKVWDIYSNTNYTFGSNQCGTYNSEGDCYNREHSFPASWFNDASPMYTDLFHLYPADGYVNGIRSNYIYAKVGTATYTSTNGSKRGNCITPGYTGTVFEPADEYKGDLARMLFYMATRYENIIHTWYANNSNANIILQNNSFPVYESWYLDMLGEWHVNDPVSQKEIDRNNAVYARQGNRNPFIDRPDFVYKIWGVGSTSGPASEPPAHVNDFSGKSLLLQWTDAAGTVPPVGYLVRWSLTSYDDIPVPADGVVYNGPNDRYVLQGVQQLKLSLPAGTYFFKLFPYTGIGESINYKTDGAVPQLSKVVN
ncbi:MAG TPA: endonuclease [Bacteroidales bacterium]|nr:endonuclease [Bacteroidales bacterium]